MCGIGTCNSVDKKNSNKTIHRSLEVLKTEFYDKQIILASRKYTESLIATYK